jgi:hypothetical protein
MSNLTPVKRMDKNGHLVTRHVKQDDHSTGASLNAPAVTLGGEDKSVSVVPKQRTVIIRPERLDRAVKRLETANKRLERAGMEGFTWQITQREENVVARNNSFNGISQYIDVVDLVIDYPEIKTATHDFVGSLTQEESGMLTRLSEGTELGDWRPQESFCDHCGTHRKRNFTVIVRDHETGEYSQVGSSCVEGYLGVDPSHLFSLNFDPLGDEIEDLAKTGNYSYGFSVEKAKTDIRKSLALAFVLSNDGEDYQKRTDWWQGIPNVRVTSDKSTFASVLAGLRDVDEDHPDYEWTKEVQGRAEERLKDGSVDAFITEILNDPSNSEYMENLKVLMSGDECHLRNLGLLVSAVSVYHKKRKAEAEAQQAPHRVNEWLAAPGDKLTDLKAKVERVRYSETAYGMTSIVTMRLDSGHEMTWFASNSPDVLEGDSVDIKATTVKKHDEWQGNKTTVVTRTKLAVTDRPQDRADAED